MPEKPEVITVCKALEERIVGKKISNCHVFWDNIIGNLSVFDFQNKVSNQKIHQIFSRGKFIVIELDDYYLLIHLRMEGKFTFRDVGVDLGKHEHVEFILDNNISWRYHDVRKFGKMYLIQKDRENNINKCV